MPRPEPRTPLFRAFWRGYHDAELGISDNPYSFYDHRAKHNAYSDGQVEYHKRARQEKPRG